MRYTYLKDISHLKEYMYLKDNSQTVIDYVDVRYFEPTKDVDERTQTIINEKISQMGMIFNT